MMEQQVLSQVRGTQLVVVVKLEGSDKNFVELMVIGELLEAYTVGNDNVLHKTVNVHSKQVDQEKPFYALSGLRSIVPRVTGICIKLIIIIHELSKRKLISKVTPLSP
ncbi:hypothetical protein Tco_1231420 [Tanacetum coccineum]